MEAPHPDEATLNSLHPIVREWFTTKFNGLSPPQRYSILNIHNRANTLISSPTGSGKTLSAFLAIINDLVLLQEQDALEDKVYCVYISPLKALANDITRNLKEPLAEIKALAKAKQQKVNVRVATRTGDTTPSQKAGMLKKPPHILITTPESLAISLTTVKFRDMLRTTRFLIIDEIHALAENKRGVHLNLSVERLQALIEEEDGTLCRIGLSATVSPLDEVARFLVGHESPGATRDCAVVDVQALKKLDLKVLTPVDDIIRATHAQQQAAMYELIHDLIQQHKTTLVFTNTRAATERIVHQLKQRYPKDYHGILEGDTEEELLEAETEAEIAAEQTPKRRAGFIGAHHGSLSKAHRLRIETRLKKGELKAVVCSTSLELGIDIGSIDLVLLLGSPKSVARALQRIGRSGHQLDETAKGRIIVLDRDDMIECSVLLKAAIEKKIDTLHLPKNCLDVLAQHVFGMAIEKQRSAEELYGIIRRSHCYATLGREEFTDVLNYLSGEYAPLQERSVYAKIWWDRDTGMVGKRGKLARLIALTNIGTIPDETNVKVKIKDEVIGTIDEGFLERLSPGDVFVLGGETYEFRFSRGMTAQVKTSAGRPPTVPSWVSESLPLSYDLALEIQTFRQYAEQLFSHGRDKAAIMQYLDDYLYADARTLNSVYEYLHEQFRYAKIPHRKRLVVEHYKEGSKRYAIVHALYGRRVNDVLSRALAYVLGRLHKRDVEVNISDNGFTLRSTAPLNVRRAVAALKAEELPRLMRVALDKSEVLSRRFRHCAARALMILRTYRGQSKSVGKQQMSSRLLLSTVKRISEDFAILKETRREVLEDLMDLRNAEAVVRELEDGSLRVEEIVTDVPSPFAFNLILQGYTDILKIEEKKEFLKRMHEHVLARIGGAKTEKFSYEAAWQEARERRLAEQDEEEERLKRLLWNQPQVPLYAKEALMPVLEGKTSVRPDVEERLEQHKEEVLRTWPAELVRAVFGRLGIAYDEEALAAEEERSVLRRELAVAARKARLEDEVRAALEAVIDGAEPSAEARAFVAQLLSGTVPKAWGDALIGFLKQRMAA